MKTVLVADDNLTIQRMAIEILSRDGIEVVTVANGMAAIKKLAAVNPSVVLADADMPGKDGYEVCDFLKKNAEFAHVGALLVVGDADPYDEARGASARVDGVVKKPFDREALMALVHHYLDRAESLRPQSTVSAIEVAPIIEVPLPSPETEMQHAAAGVSGEVLPPQESSETAQANAHAEADKVAPGSDAVFFESITLPDDAVLPSSDLHAADKVSFEPFGIDSWTPEPEGHAPAEQQAPAGAFFEDMAYPESGPESVIETCNAEVTPSDSFLGVKEPGSAEAPELVAFAPMLADVEPTVSASTPPDSVSEVPDSAGAEPQTQSPELPEAIKSCGEDTVITEREVLPPESSELAQAEPTMDAEPAAPLVPDAALIRMIVAKVVARMAPPALPPGAVHDLEAALTEEVLAEIRSRPL
ncbi:MAG: response regulator [Terriglobia bacterium]